MESSDSSTSDQSHLVNILMENSEATNYNEAIKEWNLKLVFDIGSKTSNCECGKRIRYEHHIYNKKTGYELVLGSKCISRINSDDDPVDWIVESLEVERVLKMDDRKMVFIPDGMKFAKDMKDLTFKEAVTDRRAAWFVERFTLFGTKPSVKRSYNDFVKYYHVKKTGKLPNLVKSVDCLLDKLN